MKLEELAIKKIRYEEYNINISLYNNSQVILDVFGTIFAIKIGDKDKTFFINSTLFGKRTKLFYMNKYLDFDSNNKTHKKNYKYMKSLYKLFLGL